MTEEIQWEAIKCPEDMAPSRCPIHFTNERAITASPETIWSLLVDPKAWPSFYPGVAHVQLLEGHESLRLGTRFETNLAGQDVSAFVAEFEPVTETNAPSVRQQTYLARGIVRHSYEGRAIRAYCRAHPQDGMRPLVRLADRSPRCHV
jgi:hypothetical protein